MQTGRAYEFLPRMVLTTTALAFAACAQVAHEGAPRVTVDAAVVDAQATNDARDDRPAQPDVQFAPEVAQPGCGPGLGGALEVYDFRDLIPRSSEDTQVLAPDGTVTVSRRIIEGSAPATPPVRCTMSVATCGAAPSVEAFVSAMAEPDVVAALEAGACVDLRAPSFGTHVRVSYAGRSLRIGACQLAGSAPRHTPTAATMRLANLTDRLRNAVDAAPSCAALPR